MKEEEEEEHPCTPETVSSERFAQRFMSQLTCMCGPYGNEEARARSETRERPTSLTHVGVWHTRSRGWAVEDRERQRHGERVRGIEQTAFGKFGASEVSARRVNCDRGAGASA